jgi:hypothetical protein
MWYVFATNEINHTVICVTHEFSQDGTIHLL